MKTIFLIFALAACIFAQTAPRVGEAVEFDAGGGRWVTGRVEAIQGNIVKVRTGTGKYDFRNFSLPTNLLRVPGSGAADAESNRMRNAFISEAAKYREAVIQFSSFYDPRFPLTGFSPATKLQKLIGDLAELDSICKARYVGLTSVPHSSPNEVNYQYADWCGIASRRKELEMPVRVAAAKTFISLKTIEDQLKFVFKAPRDFVRDEAQSVLYDRDKWKQEQTIKLKPKFVEFGIEMPPDFFAELDKKADAFKALIDQTAPNRNWEQPPYADAAAERLVRSKYAVDPDYRGVKVHKLGLDDRTWLVDKTLSFVGSDSTFRYYKVEYSSYKRGWALVKLPNRPFCQAQEWIVGNSAKGLVLVSLGGSGIFMKCQ